MSKREIIARYTLIIKKLRRLPASFEEVLDYLERESLLQGYDYCISSRTFQRDLHDIRSLYNIDIQYDSSQAKYYVCNDPEPDGRERILEAFDTFNALDLTDRLSKYISFEKRRPEGTEHLYGLLHAIKNRRQIRFLYFKFSEQQESQRTIDPYLLKEFKKRWYVLGRDQRDERVKSFGLDRMSELDVTQRTFSPDPETDLQERFRYCFGIISPNAEFPKEVILSFNPHNGKYVKSLPLHHTQEVIIDNAREFRIRLWLYITHDLYMELLSFGDKVKVIKPLQLAGKLKNTYQTALKQHE
ncbi:MAG: WYL domain-containing protein [Bacteroidales bacterium]